MQNKFNCDNCGNKTIRKFELKNIETGKRIAPICNVCLTFPGIRAILIVEVTDEKL